MLTERRYGWGQRCATMLWRRVRDPSSDGGLPLQAKALRLRYERTARKAREQLGEGTLIDAIDPEAGLRLSAEAVDRGDERIYGARFAADGLYAAADMLRKTPRGYRLTAFRTALHMKQPYLEALAFTSYVLERCGAPVTGTELLLIRKSGKPPFRRVDVSARVRKRLPATAEEAKRLAAIADSEEMPEPETGTRCVRPYVCRYTSDCRVITGFAPEHPAARGPMNATVNAAHGRSLGDRLAELQRPLYFLDFESIAPALPTLPGTRPFQRVPVQFSCHRLDEGGGLTHSECLPTGGDDPRPELAEAVLRAVGAEGSIVVYGAGAERQALGALATAAPGRAAELEAAMERLVDLLPVVRDHVRHPGFGGSFGLKRTAPALVPELGWDEDGIGDGYSAALLLEALLLEPAAFDPHETAAARAALLRYCRTDTEALVGLLRALRELGSIPGT